MIEDVFFLIILFSPFSNFSPFFLPQHIHDFVGKLFHHQRYLINYDGERKNASKVITSIMDIAPAKMMVNRSFNRLAFL